MFLRCQYSIFLLIKLKREGERSERMAGKERVRLMKDQGKVSLCLLLLSSATWVQALWRTVFRRCRVSREQLGVGQHAGVCVAKSLRSACLLRLTSGFLPQFLLHCLSQTVISR